MALQLQPSRVAAILAQQAQQGQPAAQPMPAQAEEPFVWAEGGKRMTPADIRIAQELARNKMAAGADYSPIQHWSQGLARMANGWIGGIEDRRARRAGERNAAESMSVAELLSKGPGEDASAYDATLLSAAGNSYIDPIVRNLAETERKRLAQQNAPQYFKSGNDYVAYDPRTRQSNVLYQGQSDAEDYAASLGYQPGTPQFSTAMQDYVLRANGPTAYGYDVDLEGVRQENREDLEGVRQRNRLSLRQTPTYGQLNPRPSGGGGGTGGGARPSRPSMAGVVAPILDKVRRGVPLTDAEQKAWSMYRPGRGGSGGSQPSGGARTATDPKTGRKVQWNGRAWVPVG